MKEYIYMKEEEEESRVRMTVKFEINILEKWEIGMAYEKKSSKVYR